MKFVMEQWCKPGGLCYNPMSGAMSTGEACLELGIQYIAVEEESDLFCAAKHRLLHSLDIKARKRRKIEARGVECLQNADLSTLCDEADYSQNGFCGIGKKLCKFPGQRATYACGGCGQAMHDLCDWAKVVAKEDPVSRELVSVCSESCFRKERT